jgi:hypothetical protein
MPESQNTNKKIFSRQNLVVTVPLLTLAMVMGAFGGAITKEITSSLTNIVSTAQSALTGYGCGKYGSLVPATTTADSSPSYGNACTLAIVTTPADPTLSVKVVLSGVFNNTTKLMRTSLRSGTLVPASATFPASFGYTGVDSSANISATTVDWVMIEVRDSTGTNVVMKKAALLNNNGDLYDSTTNTTSIPLAGLANGSYKVILRHKNHLAISTITPITITGGANTPINFTNNSQNSQIVAGTDSANATVYGMRSGNVNSDSIINVLDAGVSANAPDSTLYSVFDTNLDGITNVIDTGLVRNSPDAVENL